MDESPLDSRADVVVIGGGIVGIASAEAMARRGMKVTVIDRGEIGRCCSYGNAGWLTPCFAVPLPMPGMLGTAMKWLLDPESPLFIQPSLKPSVMRWLLRFLRSMNHDLMLRSVRALVDLSTVGIDAFRQMHEERSGGIGFEQRGLMVVAKSEQSLQSAKASMNLMGAFGVAGSVLDPAEVVQHDPSLGNASAVGGIFYPNEAHCDPVLVLTALVERAIRHGVKFCTHTEVFDFDFDSRRLLSLNTTKGRIIAPKFLLATGAWSGAIGKKLKLRIPMMSGKGYSITVPQLESPPRMPLMLVDRKIAVTPLPGGGAKLAGTLEVVGVDESITVRRLNAIRNGAATYLAIPKDAKVSVWRGLRPCLPDGVPIMDRAKGYDNLWIATGHQMLGLQTAPASGALMADLIAGTIPSFDPLPFSASRF